MTIPKEIVEKMERVNALNAEISKWMYDNEMELEGSKYDFAEEYYNFTDKPKGKEQNNGEYCDQHVGYCEDDFYGNYYYPTESGKYFWYYYSL